jgi:hypothetical protein
MKWLPLALLLAVASAAAQQSNPPKQSAGNSEYLDWQEQQKRANSRLTPQELQKKFEDQERQAKLAKMAGADPVSLAKIAPPAFTGPCRPMTPVDSVDLKTLPVDAWFAGSDTTQLAWKIRVSPPELRMDQRHQIGYDVSILSKDLKWSGGPQELIFVSGIADSEGKWLAPLKPGHEVFAKLPASEFRVSFADCLFLRPGNYILWMALYDRNGGRRSVTKRRIQVAPVDNDPLPKLDSMLPVAVFPQPRSTPAPYFLPVRNSKPVAIDLMSVVSPADQWALRADILSWTTTNLVNSMSVLSRLTPARSSLSAFALDLVGRKIAFQQLDFLELDVQGLLASFNERADLQKTDLQTLETISKRSGSLRTTLAERLNGSTDTTRIVILVSGSLLFERGSDLTPLNVDGDCHCRIYHLRYRLNRDDVFDHVQKLISPLRPRTFHVTTPRDFRKAVAEIVRDLESL